MSQLLGHLSREFWREVGTKSREVFELMLPPADVFEDGSDLVIVLDMPGFEKDQITTRLTESAVVVTAKREPQEREGIAYWEQRPLRLTKRIQFPVRVDTGDGAATKATYKEGVLTIRLPLKDATRIRVE